MLFTEPVFFAFFGVVFALYWLLRRNRDRKRMLVVASYLFYAAWDWRFCGLILASTALDYAVGLLLRDTTDARRRRLWVTVSVVGNLTLLGFFKYYGFFVESANSLLGLFGVGGIRRLDVILPVGISFYTFQTMSYTIDVYRRRIEPIANFRDFAMFVSFFPQLVMGPILRASSFLPQLKETKELGRVSFRPLFTLFLIGFVKKACISDNIAPLVDRFYADPAGYGTATTWMVVSFYAVQLYCDFSGYTDMAIAVAGLLGYEVKRNFDFPFFAGNIADFWRRWHISFSSWLRDYLYIPLGGSRQGEARTHLNLNVTMALSGLWHGAGWTFITWGVLNGIGLSVHRAYQGLARVPASVAACVSLIAWPATLFWFAFTLIFFRAQSFSDAFTTALGLWPWREGGPLEMSLLSAAWFVPMLAAHFASWKLQPTTLSLRLPPPVFALLLGLACAAAIGFVRMEYRPFIYFQF